MSLQRDTNRPLCTTIMSLFEANSLLRSIMIKAQPQVPCLCIRIVSIYLCVFIQLLGTRFPKNTQQDASEYLSYVFETLDTELSQRFLLHINKDKSLQMVHIINAYCRNSWLNFMKQSGYSPIKDIFYHMIGTVRTCVRCQYK